MLFKRCSNIRRDAYSYRVGAWVALGLRGDPVSRPLPTGLVATSVVCVALSACSVQQPTLTPQVARVLAVGPTGLRLAIEVDVKNPNSFPLIADAVEGVVEIGGGSVLGHGLTYPRDSIPAHSTVRLATQVDIQWSNLGALAPFLMSSGPVPYVFRGKARIGGDGLNVSIPFETTGELTRAQVIGAGLRGL